jgi:predicted Zn-dependent protease with MMP-like domain
VRDAAAGALDASLGLLDPSRPPHLQAETAVPDLQPEATLRFLPSGCRDQTSHPTGQAVALHRARQLAREATAEAVALPSRESEAPVTEAQFRVLVEEAIDTIPARFAREVRNLAIVIENEPSEELLEEMETEPGDSLMGLYQGTPLNERGWGYGNQLPDRITLFKDVIEDECDGDEDEIVVQIGETLIHELGHYFGMDEEQIMEIEERYWRGEPDPDDVDDGEGS